MSEHKSLYDNDFLAWSKQQAEALRAAMRDGSNQSLDFGNLAEEIEDLGKSVRRELQSQIRRVVRHLLKLEHSPAREPRRGWAESVVDARAEIEDLLEASPSLRTELDRDVERQTQRGIDLALRDLGRYQEVDAETIAALVRAGIPVMAHCGLRPQSIHTLGGYKVQRDEVELMADAKAAEQAGAFAMVSAISETGKISFAGTSVRRMGGEPILIDLATCSGIGWTIPAAGRRTADDTQPGGHRAMTSRGDDPITRTDHLRFSPTLAERAPGFKEYLPVSNNTSDMLTISPRALSRVCRIEFNCSASFARMATLSVSALLRRKTRPPGIRLGRGECAGGGCLAIRQIGPSLRRCGIGVGHVVPRPIGV